MKKFILWFKALFLPAEQCCAELPVKQPNAIKCWYCYKKKGHLGSHQTWQGEKF